MAHGAQPTLARTLGLASLTFFGVGQILGAGIYSVIGAAAGVAGSALWLSFLTAGVVALLTGLSYAELATAFPSAGAEYVYLRSAFPRQLWTSFAVGILIIAAGAATAATVAIAFAGYLQLFLNLPSIFVALALLAVLTAVNIAGVQQSAWTNIAFTLIEGSGLVLAIAVGVRSERFGLSLAATPHAGILAAASLVFFAYLGFEDIANLAEEAHHPARDIPRAIFISLGITTLLYVLVGLASVALISPDQLAASRSPLAAAVAHHAPRLAAVIGAIALFATANTALITLIVGSRMLYSMARSGDLPRPLSRLHSDRRTPWLAALIMMTLSASVVPLREVTVTAALSSFATLVAFAAVNLCVLILRFQRPDIQRPFRIPLTLGSLPILPALGMISALVLATQFPPIVYVVGGSTLAFALLIYAGRRLPRASAGLIRDPRSNVVVRANVVETFPQHPNEVFAFFVDLRNEPKYNWQVRNVRKTSHGPIGRGTTFEGDHVGLGHVVWRLAEFNPPMWVVVDGTVAGAPYRWTAEFLPLPDGTMMRGRMEWWPRGFLRALAPAFAPLLRINARRRFREMRRLLSVGR